MKIGEQIMALRKRRGFTQAELGRLVGVSSQAVSKWESGGAPDVEMLPSIAEALGVTIDTLFGRERQEVENMTAVTARWLGSIPGNRRLSELYRLLINTFSCAFWEESYDPDLWQEGVNQRRVLDSCFKADTQGTTWIRGMLESEEGLMLGIPGLNFPMYLLLPEPEGGYGKNLAPVEEYRRLFTALAQPGALELLLCFMSRKNGLYSVGALVKLTELPKETVEAALASLTEAGVVSAREIETETGPLKVCNLFDCHGLVPLLYLARWVMEKDEFWSNGYFNRQRPILAEDGKDE